MAETATTETGTQTTQATATTQATQATATQTAKAAPNPAAEARANLGKRLEGATYVSDLPDEVVTDLYSRFEHMGTWPDDWREQLVGADDKLLKRMQRYASPKEVANALIAAQNRISSGELKASLKEKATPEEVAAWRAENGIPEKPEGYDLKFSNGIVFGEDDKPFIDSFLKSAHEANMRPEHVKAALAWYHQDRERQVEEMAARDAHDTEACQDELVAEWGADFPMERNRIFALLGTAPDGVKDFILSARGPDQQALFNNPNVIRFFSQIARQLHPIATRVPVVSGATSHEDEMQKLKSMMSNHKSEYWKGPNAEKFQARYRDLLDESRNKAA